MSRGVKAALGAMVGYLVAAPLGYGLVSLTSANTHDTNVEAAMTGVFVTGPVGGVVGLCVGLFRRRRLSAPAARDN